MLKTLLYGCVSVYVLCTCDVYVLLYTDPNTHRSHSRYELVNHENTPGAQYPIYVHGTPLEGEVQKSEEEARGSCINARIDLQFIQFIVAELSETFGTQHVQTDVQVTFMTYPGRLI